MSVASKFMGVQKSKFGTVENHSDEKMIFGFFFDLIAAYLRMRLGLNKKKFTIPDDALFALQMRQIEQKNGKPEMENFPQTISMYEISFLNKMISGKFNNYSADSFSSKMDKNLFSKYNTLSRPELEMKYQNYQKLLKATA